MAGETPRIELRNVHKAFGAKQVLAGVSLAVMPGKASSSSAAPAPASR